LEDASATPLKGDTGRGDTGLGDASPTLLNGDTGLGERANVLGDPSPTLLKGDTGLGERARGLGEFNPTLLRGETGLGDKANVLGEACPTCLGINVGVDDECPTLLTGDATDAFGENTEGLARDEVFLGESCNVLLAHEAGLGETAAGVGVFTGLAPSL